MKHLISFFRILTSLIISLGVFATAQVSASEAYQAMKYCEDMFAHEAPYSEDLNQISAQTTASLELIFQMNQQETAERLGDFQHSWWQKSNSYKTRFKPMKDKNGDPITDETIDAHIASRGINPKYKTLFYRKNINGQWEEDITQLKNSQLAYNNQDENRAGGMSMMYYIAQLLSRPFVSENEALSRLNQALQGVHTGYMTRNNSWAFWDHPYNVEKVKPAIQFTNFNPFMQLIYELNKKVPGFEFLERALQTKRSEILEKRFAPYAHLPAGKAYLGLSEELGTKPSLYEPANAEFFDSLLEKINFNMTSPLNQAAEFFQSHILPRALPNVPVSDIELLVPDTEPGSGAFVFLVRQVSTKSILAVLKLQSGQVGGLDEIVSNVATEEFFRIKALEVGDDSPNLVTETLAYGKTEGDYYFLLQTAAETRDLDGHLSTVDIDEALSLIEKSAQALANFHSIFSKEGNKYDKQAIKTFQGNAYYDIARLRSDFNQVKEMLEQTDELSIEEDQTGSNSSLQAMMDDSFAYIVNWYDNLIESIPEDFAPSIVHGDFHGGNLFLDPENYGETFIDFGTVTWSLTLSNKYGTGDRGNDIGRMMGHLLVERMKTQEYTDQNIQEALGLAEFFLHKYLANSEIDFDSKTAKVLRISAYFYVLRYFGVQAKDVSEFNDKGEPIDSVKFKSKNVPLDEMRQRLFRTWQAFLKKAKDDLK